jgi:hypothetical protein
LNERFATDSLPYCIVRKSRDGADFVVALLATAPLAWAAFRAAGAERPDDDFLLMRDGEVVQALASPLPGPA